MDKPSIIQTLHEKNTHAHFKHIWPTLVMHVKLILFNELLVMFARLALQKGYFTVNFTGMCTPSVQIEKLCYILLQ